MYGFLEQIEVDLFLNKNRPPIAIKLWAMENLKSSREMPADKL